MEKTVSEAIAYRRSVRVFKKDEHPHPEEVKACLEDAVLAATSSNLQLWEFYHITDDVLMKKMTKACLGQNAAATASQLVVVVTRKDLWKQRARFNAAFLSRLIGDKPKETYSRREKNALAYYQKLIPMVYFDFLGIVGWLKYLIFIIVGLFRPVYRQLRSSDLRTVVHKSAALASQNFMLSMAAKGYDTCPMEGSDTLMIKNILKLPRGSEICMVIACGIRDGNKGIYTERYRVPFEEVYHSL
ncbi:nitroreductase family protein [Ascidiimonas aurantiaca]|uniref:nitroreductase family protein n=1 Tax=Ascidiimonas aurantiaca TaxID=1685432 RepID=UPI0030ECA907